VDEVRLPDLEVIRRYSIAVRSEHAPADEVIAALRADLERLSVRAATPKRPARARPAARPKTGTRRRR
jgi:hypothetical protein